MYCMWLGENTVCKKSPSQLHRTTFLGCVFASKAYIDSQNKLVKQRYVLHVSS